ncbi:PBS lyase [Pseudomonas nitroreducens]|uniref:PBS lyase n=1 Tax=Pseudomonas nitroreducens TaxID=46680 RepID=UPI003D294FA1
MKQLRHWLERRRSPAPSTDETTQALRNWLAQQRPGYGVNEALTLLANASPETDWPGWSRSHNGYVRELAVRMLARRRSAEALGVLLTRANDWVPAIRLQALQGIEGYLADGQVSQVLQNLPQLLALSRQQRGDHGALLQEVQSLLARPGHAAEVKAAWIALRGQAARLLFRVLAEGDGSAALLEQALRHPDPVVRILAVDAARKQPIATRQALLHTAMTNASATVRGKALRLLMKKPMAPLEALERGLLDSSASVRSIALWHSSREGVEPAMVLQRSVSGAMPATTAHWLGVLGLSAALGKPVPTAWLDAALRSASARTRLAAIAQLDDEALPAFIGQLEHPSPKVFRGTLERLRKLSWQSLQGPVSHYLDQHWPELDETRREAIFNLLAYWQRLAYLLRQIDEAPGSTYWVKALRSWSYQRYPGQDPLTPDDERQALAERIRQLVATGHLPKGSLTCID